MNERIMELAKKAGFNEYINNNLWPEEHTEFNNIVKNFSELLIQECIDIVDKVYDDQTGVGAKMCRRATPYQEIINEIEEHFGVE
jgi:hypothetical protein